MPLGARGVEGRCVFERGALEVVRRQLRLCGALGVLRRSGLGLGSERAWRWAVAECLVFLRHNLARLGCDAMRLCDRRRVAQAYLGQ